MKIHHRHPWPDSVDEARAIQERLRDEVVCTDRFDKVNRVAGIDVGFENRNSVTRAAVAVLDFPGLELCEKAIARRPTTFPYIPGYLSFREIPAVLDALEKLTAVPDLLLCDGQGIAHPRRFGIACHLGVLTDIPSIGVAKKRLIGQHEDVAQTRGTWVPLYQEEEVIGAVLRTRVNTKPLYISPGHRISLETAVSYVMRCTTRYRLPETTRHAHRLASGPLGRKNPG